MANTYIRTNRVRAPGSSINDALAPTDHDSNAVDLLDTLGYMASQIADITGETAWETAPDASLSTIWAKTFLDEKLALREVFELDHLTVPAGQNYSLISVASGEIPAIVKAIGASTEGLLTAEHDGTFGTSHSLAEVSGDNTINPKNLLAVVDHTTHDVILSGGQIIWGLLQHEATAGDGTLFTDITPERAQISFVRVDGNGNDLEAVPFADIQNLEVHLSYVQRLDLDSFVEQDFLRRTAFVDLPAAGASVTLDNAIDNQGATASTAATDIEIRLNDDTTWSFETSDGGVSLLDLSPAAAGDTVAINSDDLDVNTTNSADFNQGIKVDSADTLLNLGVTAGQIDAGAAALKLYSSGAAVTVEGTGVNLESGSGDLAINTNDLYVDSSSSRTGFRTNSPQAPVHLAGLNTNAEGLRLEDGTDNVGIYVVDADPDTSIAAQKGSMALDYTNGKMYINTNGSTSWQDYSVGLFTGYAVAAQAAQGTDVASGTGELSGDVDIRGAVNQINISRDSATQATFGLAEQIEVETIASRNNTSNVLDLDTATNGMSISSDAEWDVNAAGAVTVDGTTVSIDGTGDSNFTTTGNAVGDVTLTLSSTNSGTGDGDISIDADDDVFFTDERDTNLTLSDATSGSIANLFGGTHTSISAAILAAGNRAAMDIIAQAAQGTDVGTTTGALAGEIDFRGAVNQINVNVDSGTQATFGLAEAIEVETVASRNNTSNILDLDTGTNGISLTSDAEIDLNATGGITADGTTVSIDGTDAMNLTMTANDAAAKSLTIQSTNSGAGAGHIGINSADALDLDSGAGTTLDATTISIDGTDTMNVTMTANAAGAKNFTIASANSGAGPGNLLLNAGNELDLTSDTLDVNVTGAAVMDAASYDINSTGDVSIDGTTVSIDGTDTMNLTMTAASASVETMTLAASNSGAGVGDIAVSTDGDFYVNTNDLFVDSSANRLGLQTASPATPLHMASLTTNAEAIRLDDGTDTVGIFPVDADPNGSVTGTAGSIALDYTNGELYVCTADGTTWSAMSSSYFSDFAVAAQAAQGTDVAHGAGQLTGDVDIRGAVNQINISRDSATQATFGLAEAIEVETVASRNNTSNIMDLDTATNGISLTSDAEIDLNATGGVTVDGTTLSLDGTDTTNLTMTANDAGAKNLTVASSNAGAGAGNLLLSADDEADITANNIDLNTTAGLAWDGTTFDINGSGAITVDGTTLSLDGTDSTNLTMTANDAGAKTMTIAASNAGVGVSNIAVSADGDFAINTNDFVVDTSANRIGLQTASPATPLHMASLTTNTEAIRLDDGTDTVGIFTVDADPNGSVTGTAGSIALDYTNGKIHICTADGTTWDDLSTGLFEGFAVAAQAAQGTDVAHGAGELSGDVDIRGAVNQINIQRESATLATFGLAEAIEVETIASRDNTSNILDLDTATNGMQLSSDAEIDLNSTGGLTWDGTTLDLSATGAVTVDGTTVSIDGTDTMNLTMSANSDNTEQLSIQAVNSGSGSATLLLSAGNIVDVNSNNLDIDITSGTFIDTSTLSIDSTDTSNLTMSANAAATKNLTISATNADVGGTANLLLGADDEVDITAGNLDVNITSGAVLDASAFTFTSSGDFVVNTNDFVVDTSTNRIGLQTATPQAPLHMASLTTNTEAVRLSDATDRVGIYVVDADPNGSVTGTAGSIAMDYTNGELYVCTADGTTWSAMSASYFSDFAVAAQAAQGTDVAHGAGQLTGDVDIRGAVNQINISRDSATQATFGLAEAIEVETIASRNNTSNIIDLDTATNGMQLSSDAEFDVNATGAVTIDGTTVSLDGTDSTNLTMSANDAGAKTLTIQSSNAGVGDGDISIGADDDIFFTDNRDTNLALSDSTAGSIAGLFGGTHTSISAAILEAGTRTDIDIIAQATQGTDVGTTTGALEGEVDFRGAVNQINVNVDSGTQATFGLAETIEVERVASRNNTSNIIDLDTASNGMQFESDAEFDFDAVGTFFVDCSHLSLDSTDSTNLTMTANDASTKTLTIQANNAGAGEGNIFLDTDDLIDMDAANLDIDLSAGYFLDTGSFSLDSVDTSNMTMTASSSSAKNLTISATNGSTGTGNLLLGADDEVDITSDTLDINMTGAITVNSTTQEHTGTDNMTITMNANEAGGRNIIIDANNSGAGTAAISLQGQDEVEMVTALVDINADDLDIDLTDAYTMDAASFSLDSTDTSNITQTANDAGAKTMTVSSANSGAGAGHLLLSAGDDVQFTTTEDTALPLTDGTSGSIASLFGGSHASVGAAIQAAGGLADISIKFTTLGSDYAQDVNVPGAIQDITAYPIDMESPADVEQLVFLNGSLMAGGNGTTNNDVYAGTTPASGDVKFDHPDGVSTGDFIISVVIPKS